MRLSVIISCGVVAALATSYAAAQIGPYGAPETLQFGQADPVAYNAYLPTAYPTALPAQQQPAQGVYAAQPVTYPTAQPSPAYSGGLSPWFGRPAAAPTPYPSTALASPRPGTLAAQPAMPYGGPAPTTPTLAPGMASTPAASSTESKPAASSPSPSDSSLAAQMLGQPACGTFGCYGGQATCGVGQGCGQPRGWFGGGGLFAGPCNQYQQAATACTSGYGDACVTNNCGAPCNPWYAGVTALVVGRNCANRVWTTYETGNEPNQLMNTCDIGQKWRFGGEVRLGRRFCCDQWALEVSYWTADPFQGTHSMTNPAGVSTPLSTGFLAFAGDPVGNYFDGAAEHRLWRREEFHNVEVNLFRNQLWCDGYCPLSVDVLGGFRFFRFEESLTFATLQGGCVWGQNGGRNQAYLNDVVENNLWGAQIGFNCQYRLAQCFTLNIMPKFGLYDNHITNNFRLYRGDGVSAVSTHPGVPGGYPVRDVTDQVSFLTQIDIGCEWYFAPRWSLTAGYRVVAITGMALADHQITHYLVDLPEVSHTKTNGDLILHGAYLGVTYSF